jgi:hypothetical protein
MVIKTSSSIWLAAMVWFLTSTGAVAQTPVTHTFDGFRSTASWTLNGSAAKLNANGQGALSGGNHVLRLTDAVPNDSGSAFLSQRIWLNNQASFSAAFQFEISKPGGISDMDGPGADGLAFVVQTKSDKVGGAGGSMGYGGVSPSVAVEFDTYQNSSSGDADGNHVGVNINGALTSDVQAPVRERMNDGGIRYAWLDYDGSLQTMEARIARTPDRPTLPIVSMTQIDLPKNLGRADVYVGFASATGGAYNIHDVRYFQFTNTFLKEGAVMAPPSKGRIDTFFLIDGSIVRAYLQTYSNTQFEARKEDGQIVILPRKDVQSVMIGQ